MDSATGARTVRLEVPARPGYVVLARLALSAVCRLTPLEHDEVADLKLAITEAASTFVGSSDAAPGPLEPAPGGDSEPTMFFEFGLDDSQLSAVVSCAATPALDDEERELSRAIIAATVDSCEAEPGLIRLTKHLAAGAG